jgi:N-acetylmuramoyl-L-alanine amidase
MQFLRIRGWKNAFLGAMVSLLSVAVMPALSQMSGVMRPVIQMGSQGNEVSELQAALKLLGYFPGNVDAYFGESTVVAVTQFQQSAGIEADGVVGSATWNRLFPPATGGDTYSPQPMNPQPVPVDRSGNNSRPAESNPYPILRRGARGAAVLGLQARLRAIGVFSGEVDGVFGEATEAAVSSAQRQFALEPDGIVGPATWEAIMR